MFSLAGLLTSAGGGGRGEREELVNECTSFPSPLLFVRANALSHLHLLLMTRRARGGGGGGGGRQQKTVLFGRLASVSQSWPRPSCFFGTN